MASGVEVAGLLLGVFPLVIEGLKFYLEGIQTIKKWWKYTSVIKHLIRRLRTEETKFYNTCTELLHDLVTAPVLALLLEKPGGFYWKDADLQIKLRQRLGRSFNSYLEAVTDMTNVLDEFKDMFELGDDNKPKWVDYKVYKREWKRVKLALSEDRNTELLERMEKNNEDLETLLGQSLRLEAITVPKSANNAKNYIRVRTHAKALYYVLKQGLTSPCGCSVPHNANLRLKAWGSGPGNDSGTQNIHFDVVFYFDTESPPANALPWNWRETVIEPLLEKEYEGINSNVTAQTPCLSQSTDVLLDKKMSTDHKMGFAAATGHFLAALGGSSSLQPKPLRKARSRVSFASSPASSRSTTPETLPSASTSLDILTDKSQVAQDTINDLCKAICNVKDGTPYLGVLVDDCNKQHRVNFVKKSSFLNTEAQNISLETLLMQGTRLEKRDRLILGVKLASTLLQLHSTPWLRDSWGKCDILFVKSLGQGADLSNTSVTKPFVSKPFVPPSCTTHTRALTDPRAKPSPQVRNRSIFALAVVLIELWYGKPLEELRIPADMGERDEANDITDFATARRVLDDIYKEAGEWYGDAVRRCIYCEFDQRYANLDTEALTEAVHKGVVAPLRENLTAFCGGKLEGLLV